MKKLAFATALLAAFFMMASCSDDIGEKVTEELTADEQKAKMNEIGENIVNLFNTEDFKSTINLVDWCAFEFKGYDFDECVEFIADVIDMPKIYALKDFYATFEADKNAKIWKQTSIGGNALVFNFMDQNNASCSLKIAGNGKELTIKDEDGDYGAVIPSSFTAEVIQNNNKLLSSQTSLSYKNGSSLNVTEKANIADKLIANGSYSMSTSKIEAKADLTVAGTEAISANFSMNTSKFPVINENEDPKDYAERLKDYFDGSFKADVTFSVNLYKSMQVKGKMDGSCIDEINNIQDNIDDGIVTEKKGYEQIADILNSKTDAKIYYNSDIVQAELRWEAQQDNYNSWNIEPVIYFPKDDTSYAFDEYFTKDGFKSLIKATEKKINSFIKLFTYIELGQIKLL